MGRIVDLCGEIAAAADEGPEGLAPAPEAWDRLRQDWSDEDIEDALGFVKDSVLQSELVEASDSLSARLVELLGTWGEAKGWAAAVEGHATISIDVIRQVAHRLDRLEEILEVYRDQKGPDRRGFDELQRRLMDQGIEDEMRPDPAAHAGSRRARAAATTRRSRTPAQAGGSPCRTRWTSRSFTCRARRAAASGSPARRRRAARRRTARRSAPPARGRGSGRARPRGAASAR